MALIQDHQSYHYHAVKWKIGVSENNTTAYIGWPRIPTLELYPFIFTERLLE